MAMEEQQLFLMEFLVDKVNIPAVRAIHDEMLPVVTCVSFQILSLPRIDIFQDAPTSGCSCNEGDVQTFRKGKSCLFALPTMVLQKPISSFPITMCVYKKLPPGVLPDVMLIGSHQIQGKYIMNALLSDRAFKGGNPCKATKDSFKITTATGQCVGEVTLFVRVSCFGKKIVTQFQIPHNRKPYLFKGAEDSPVFQCKRIPSTMQQRPAPSCTCCPLKRVTDGSGEAMRTCCSPNATRSSMPNQQCEARPCCPSRQASPSPDGRNRQQSKGRLSSTAGTPSTGQSAPYCPPCCAQGQSADSKPLCQQSAYVPATRRSSKPPCCPPPMCPPPPCPPPPCPPPPCPPCPPPRCPPPPCSPCPPPPCPPCPPPSCPPPRCQPCCPPPQCRLGCPPPNDLKDFISLITKEPKLRKCGCVIKEDQGCCCGRK